MTRITFTPKDGDESIPIEVASFAIQRLANADAESFIPGKMVHFATEEVPTSADIQKLIEAVHEHQAESVVAFDCEIVVGGHPCVVPPRWTEDLSSTVVDPPMGKPLAAWFREKLRCPN